MSHSSQYLKETFLLYSVVGLATCVEAFDGSDVFVGVNALFLLRLSRWKQAMKRSHAIILGPSFAFVSFFAKDNISTTYLCLDYCSLQLPHGDPSRSRFLYCLSLVPLSCLTTRMLLRKKSRQLLGIAHAGVFRRRTFVRWSRGKAVGCR